MPRVLSTSSTHGTFDFLSNVITLNRFEARNKQQLEEAMWWEPGVPQSTQDKPPNKIAICAQNA